MHLNLDEKTLTFESWLTPDAVGRKGFIQTGSLMDVDVESVLGLHLERGLNTGIREDGGR